MAKRQPRLTDVGKVVRVLWQDVDCHFEWHDKKAIDDLAREKTKTGYTYGILKYLDDIHLIVTSTDHGTDHLASSWKIPLVLVEEVVVVDASPPAS